MRKLIVLIMTSVLATGAVANADQATVVENAQDFIQIGVITEQDGGALSPGITPKIGAPLYHRLDVDVSDSDDELVQVAVCLYDSAVITDPDNSNCGDGATDLSSLTATDAFPKTTSYWEGQTNLESALQMAFLPLLHDPSLADDNSNGRSIGGMYPSGGSYHTVASEQVSGSNQSRVTEVGTLGSNNAVSSGDVWALEFAFSLLPAAHHTATWKIRVLATYEDAAGVETKLELIDTTSYEVEYFQAFDGTGRDATTVNYGEVAHDSSATETGITTGDYYVNSESHVTLTADLFKESADTTNILGFSGDQSPADGQVSLECAKTGEAKSLFDAILSDAAGGSDESSKALLSLAPNSQPVGGADPADALTADTHDCTFYAGTNIDTGEYSNSITIAIVEGSMP